MDVAQRVHARDQERVPAHSTAAGEREVRERRGRGRRQALPRAGPRGAGRDREEALAGVLPQGLQEDTRHARRGNHSVVNRPYLDWNLVRF